MLYWRVIAIRWTLIAEDEDIYLGYDGEVDTSRPYDDEDEEEEEEEE